MDSKDRKIVGVIATEEPDIHWAFLNVKDKVVLDLGCGVFYSQKSTTEWFKEQGAKRIIGVDMGDYVRGDFEFIQMTIQNQKQLEDLLKYKPDIIKCDIEGAEVFWEGVKTLGRCKQFAVEYHSNELKILMEEKMKEWGFNLEFYQLFSEDINRVGVIHGWKNF